MLCSTNVENHAHKDGKRSEESTTEMAGWLADWVLFGGIGITTTIEHRPYYYNFFTSAFIQSSTYDARIQLQMAARVDQAA